MHIAGCFFLPVDRLAIKGDKELFLVEQTIFLVGVDGHIVAKSVAHNRDIVLYIEEIILHTS